MALAATTHIPKQGDVVRKWHLVDASGQTLGRLASRVARILAGKESTQYTPFIDAGDHVIVINAEKIKLTGEKANKKVYHRITGYPGGLRTESFKKLSMLRWSNEILVRRSNERELLGRIQASASFRKN